MSTARDHAKERALYFERALHAVGARGTGKALLERLLAAYAEPHRRYHDLAHVESCLAWLDWHFSLAEHPHEIALALWFHDAVYEPLKGDNEAKSAAWAVSALTELGARADSVARIEAMILATKGHVASTPDEALMLSIDLAILGASPSVYERFERDARAEYAMVPDDAYAEGRTRVLAALLAHTPLYPNPVIAAQLEKRARKNVGSELARLKG